MSCKGSINALPETQDHKLQERRLPFPASLLKASGYHNNLAVQPQVNESIIPECFPQTKKAFRNLSRQSFKIIIVLGLSNNEFTVRNVRKSYENTRRAFSVEIVPFRTPSRLLPGITRMRTVAPLSSSSSKGKCDCLRFDKCLVTAVCYEIMHPFWVLVESLICIAVCNSLLSDNLQ